MTNSFCPPMLGGERERVGKNFLTWLSMLPVWSTMTKNYSFFLDSKGIVSWELPWVGRAGFQVLSWNLHMSRILFYRKQWLGRRSCSKRGLGSCRITYRECQARRRRPEETRGEKDKVLFAAAVRSSCPCSKIKEQKDVRSFRKKNSQLLYVCNLLIRLKW